MEEKVRILVVDDHSLVLEGICRVLEQLPEIQEIDAVSSSREAVQYIENQDYDAYVLDVSMPDISGFDLIAKIRELNPGARIVINTMHEEVWIVNRLLQSKVNAIVLKASASFELQNAVRNVLHGDSYACPRFASISQKLQRCTASILPHDRPTKRELDVLLAMSKGLSSREIADLLGISENTVETFRRRLIVKFGAKNGTEMVVKAISQGWISLS